MTVRSSQRTFAFAALDGVAVGVGVAIGVALATWLTAAWGTGAPGPASLDVSSDLLAVPLLAGLVAGFLVFAVSSIARGVRSARSARVAHGDEGDAAQD